MRQKLLSIFLVFVLMFSFTACGKKGNNSSKDNESSSLSDTTDDNTTDNTDSSLEDNASTDSSLDDYTDEDFIIPVEDTNDSIAGGNSANRLNPMTGGAEKEATVLRNTILNSANSAKPKTGNIWYISRKGNDANSGKTPSEAWYSIEGYNANKSIIRAGDTVLFERNGVYRGAFGLISGVTYGAYGNGAKPAIYGSPDNYAASEYWEKTDTPNVWRCTEIISKDVGNIVFDHGRAVGICIYTKLSDLSKNLEYYWDKDYSTLYLYLEKNPSTVFYDIEFCISGNLLQSPRNCHDVTIENLSLKYVGTHAIRFENGAEDIIIRNCEIGWIGGAIQYITNAGYPVRLGNAIEFWNECDSLLIENNWIYQIYDTGITHQGGITADGYTQSNITCRSNLIEYCTYSLEVWAGYAERDKMENILYENNILRFAGYGWGMVRTNHGDTSHLRSTTSDITYKATNFVIRNNIFDCSWKVLIVQKGNAQPNIKYIGNSYYQRNDSETVAFYWQGDNRLKSTDQATFEASVKVIDEKPKLVKLLGSK